MDSFEPHVSQQGWHYDATLQCFKAFRFGELEHLEEFLMEVIHISDETKIHISATPRKESLLVEVSLYYSNKQKYEAEDLIDEIEQIYVECSRIMVQ